MAFMDGLSKIAKNVGDQAAIASKKANEALEIAKINSSIKSEEDKIQKIKTEIGNKVFEKFQKCENTDSEVLQYCNNIVEIINNIDQLKNKISIIKNG